MAIRLKNNVPLSNLAATMPEPGASTIPNADDFARDLALVQGIAAIPKILDVVCHATGMGFAAVARVTEQKWICCAVRDDIGFGLLPGGELEIRTTICNEVRENTTAVVIDHVAQDPLFRSHHTPAQYGFQSYISMPIVMSDGSFFGTLCAIDPKPAVLQNSHIVDMFKLFAELIAIHLESAAQAQKSEALLLDERQTSVLREQFIAVLGHDPRNPLASVEAGVRLLHKTVTGEKESKILVLMRQSAGRMSGLIDNVLDFARGRLGGGLLLSVKTLPLQDALQQVIDELQASYPSRTIEVAFDLKTPVRCDPGRIAQLFSNLLGNALYHGSPTRPVCVTATSGTGSFELSVANGGETIPPDIRERLFAPFSRGTSENAPGLGLGLFIASEIARAHGGEISVVSDVHETRFTFRMSS